MNTTIQSYFHDLDSKDKEVQYEAYNKILAASNEKVDWAYDVWNQLMQELTDTDPHKRSRAAQFLSNLAKSDPEKRMLDDFQAVLDVTKDKKFVTARHSLQSIWKVGLAGPEQKSMVISSLADRYIHCHQEKNYTLIRFDIIQGLRSLYNEAMDEDIKNLALDLIHQEEDPKYQKKYAAVWEKA